MGQSAAVTSTLPPLPPGATLNAPPPQPSASALPPLPPGAQLNTPSAPPQPEQKPHWYNALMGAGGDGTQPDDRGFFESAADSSGISSIPSIISDPVGFAKSIPKGIVAEGERSLNQLRDAWHTPNNRPVQAIDRTLYAIPFVGGALKEADQQAHEGNYAGAAGTAAGLGLSALLPEAAARGASSVVEHVAPRVLKVGEREFPVLRSQEEGASKLQEFAAKPNDRKIAKVQQQVGQQVIEDAAKGATERNIGEMNQHLASETPEEEYMRKRFGAGTPEEQEAAHAAKQIDAQAAVKRTHSLVDAADELKSEAQKIDERLGAGTDERYKGLQRDLRDAERETFHAGDEDKASAQAKVEAIRDQLDNYFTESGSLNSGDIAARNKAWHRQYILRDAGNAIESSFNLTPQTAEDIRVSRIFDPKAAQKRLIRVERQVDMKYGKGAFANAIGPDALRNMHTVFNYMAESPANAAGANRMLVNVAKILAGGEVYGVAQHFGKGPVAAGAFATTLAAKKLLHTIATNPKIANQFIYGLKYARPRAAAPFIAGLVRQTENENEKERQAEQQ